MHVNNTNQLPLFQIKQPSFFCGICHTNHVPGQCKHNNLDNIPYLPENYVLKLQNFKLSFHDACGLDSHHVPSVHSRGNITSFSPSSSRRMKNFLASLDYSKFQFRIFFTCTYRYIYPDNKFELHNHLLRIIKRLERLIPGVFIVWRIELQKRGAPHFHFLLFSKTKYSLVKKIFIAKEIKKDWGQITASVNDYSFTVASDIVELTSSEKILGYIAKYSSKRQSDVLSIDYGRLWGFRGSPVHLSEKKFFVTQAFIIELRRQLKIIYSKIPNPSDDFLFYLSFHRDPFFFLTKQTIKKIIQICIEKTKCVPKLVLD